MSLIEFTYVMSRFLSRTYLTVTSANSVAGISFQVKRTSQIRYKYSTIETLLVLQRGLNQWRLHAVAQDLNFKQLITAGAFSFLDGDVCVEIY